MAKPSWGARTNLKHKRTNSDTVPSWAHRAKRLKGPSKIGMQRGWSLKTVAAKLALILPAWWCKLCIEAAHRSTDQSTIFGVEAFSGKGMLARALSNHIGPFVTFELQDDSRDNLLLKKRPSTSIDIIVSCLCRRTPSPWHALQELGVLKQGVDATECSCPGRAFCQPHVSGPTGVPDRAQRHCEALQLFRLDSASAGSARGD